MGFLKGRRKKQTEEILKKEFMSSYSEKTQKTKGKNMSGNGDKTKANYKRRGTGGGGPQPLKSEKGEGKRHLAKALKKPLKRRKK